MTSKGALIFAYNTKFDYLKVAKVAARLVKKNLGIPVTIVTDTVVDDPEFDHIWVDTQSQFREFRFGSELVLTEWKNQNRFDAYTLSPYDQTLLIDADYFVMSNHLKKLFDTDLEFACYDKVFDVTDENRFAAASRLSQISIPMQWATVVYFTKNHFAKSVFEFMHHIKLNYKYYAQLYGFRPDVYRNDYSLSIALQALSGYSTQNYTPIPGKLVSFDSSLEIIDIVDKNIVFRTNSKVTKLCGVDVHIMNKQDLQSDSILSKLENA